VPELPLERALLEIEVLGSPRFLCVPLGARSPCLQRPERVAPQEETRIPRRSLRLVCRGRPLRVDDGAASFLVHPFLFSTTEGLPDVTLNWENDEVRWVTPDEVADFDAVPSLVRPSAAMSMPHIS
jgi:hypothetical protein